MTDIFGPTGRRRVRRALAAAVITAMALALFPGDALAVHDTGAFQLEGNAVTDAGVPGDDWDRVCHQVTGADCGTTSDTTGASAVAWSDDRTVNATCAGGNNCTVFTGGGSKDPHDISDWNWKTDTGGLPAKDNLQHGFAARYTLPASASCPNGSTPPAGTCKLLYFGMDRIDNSGDAQNGFWFFQNKITLKADGTFNGLHRVGDLLVLSDFSNGGGTSTINIYEWDPAASDGPLHFLTGGAASRCGGATADAFCGIVNPNDGTTAPWPYLDKSGNTTYLNGEFYEGGINLSLLPAGIAGECFASVAAESRSSVSTTATLKDFVLENFGNCESGTVTTPQDSSGTSISNGSVSITTAGSVNVQDMAEITVTGIASFTGNVTFRLCGPTPLTDADYTACPSGGGAQIGDPKPVSGASPQTATSDLAQVTSVGRYCFRADFHSTTDGVPDSSDSTVPRECFQVTPVTPTINTHATGTAPINTPITDTATLGGTANRPGTPVINPTTPGGPAGGTITFSLYGPSASPSCVTAIFTSTVNVSGNGDYTSGSYSPSQVGTYYWIATYSGDAPNTLGATTACGDGGEASVITDTSSLGSHQKWLPNDSATATSGSGTTALNGTLTIELHESNDCSGTAVQTYTKTLTNASSLADRTLTTTNQTYLVETDKSVSWKATFASSDPLVTSPAPFCEVSTVDLTPNQP